MHSHLSLPICFMQTSPKIFFHSQRSRQSRLRPLRKYSTFQPIFPSFTDPTQKPNIPTTTSNPTPKIQPKISAGVVLPPILNKLIYIIYHMLRTLSRLLPRFSTEVQKSSAKPSSSGLTYYKDGQLVNRTSLTLKKQEDIESYVVKTVQNYFRTTYKQGTRSSIQA